MAVIAMTREMGTRGKDVAARLAAELDLDVVHQELVAQDIGRQMGVAESSVLRFLEGRSSLWDRWQVGPTRISRYTAREILELALGGKVIIRGWGGAQVLRHIPHVVKVRIRAPIEKRVDEVFRRLNEPAWEASKPIEHAPSLVREGLWISRHQVRREIERNDCAHTRLILRHFGTNWQDPSDYDIVLDTGEMSIGACVDRILALAASADHQPTEASLEMLKQRLAWLAAKASDAH
jgi:cytidylate kinase